MNVDTIRKFYSVHDKFFEKTAEIAKAMDELEMLKLESMHALRDTVDNGLTTKYLVKVSADYDKHKFMSNDVQKFAEDMSTLLFKGLSSSKIDRLEMTSMTIDVIYDTVSDAHINGPVVLRFIDTKSKKTFSVNVPVGDSTFTDVVHWDVRGDGMYIVHATPNDAPIEICRVFDVSKVADAVSKYMDGDFDEDFMTSFFRTYNIPFHRFSNDSIDMSGCFIKDDNTFSEFRRMFNGSYNSILQISNEQIEHCIDDRNEYV